VANIPVSASSFACKQACFTIIVLPEVAPRKRFDVAKTQAGITTEQVRLFDFGEGAGGILQKFYLV
jgi:hypothetical protein